MQLRYAYRLEPSPAQERALRRTFGCARVVYNDGLAARRDAFAAGQPYLSGAVLSTRLPEMKQTLQRAWLGEVSAVVLQQALRDLDQAYRNYFDSLSGKRKGRAVGVPRFRSRKDSRQSIRFTRTASFRITPGGRLRLQKIGDVPVRWSRSLPSAPSSVTVILDSAGRFYASFVVEVQPEPLPPVGSEVGIDLGLTTFAVLSDGRRIENPRLGRKAERKLAKAQRDLGRKQRGSRNREKARLRVAKRHAGVKDARRDWLQKESTRIIRENQAVYVEDLSVAGLARTRLAKSVTDAGWSSFTSMLEYKAALYGRTFARVDRWFPSTRMCSACGVVGEKKPLSVREWRCACGVVHDRDLNAARNILAAGRADSNACGADVSPCGTAAVGVEAGTLRELAHA